MLLVQKGSIQERDGQPCTVGETQALHSEFRKSRQAQLMPVILVGLVAIEQQRLERDFDAIWSHEMFSSMSNVSAAGLTKLRMGWPTSSTRVRDGLVASSPVRSIFPNLVSGRAHAHIESAPLRMV